MSIDRAKTEASRKIQQGGLAVLKNEILPLGRQRASCRWQDTGHTYRDAEKLARYWGYNSPSEAKVKVASLYTRGLTGQVRRSLRAASASNNNNGGGQIGEAISADAFAFKCKDGRRLNVNVVKQGNKRYAEATLGGQRSGRMPRVSKKKWANGRYKVRFRNDLARIDWKGTKMWCSSSN